MRFWKRLRSILPTFALVLFAEPLHAQQAGGIAIDIPGVRNYAALGVGAVPDYIGSDDYTVGIAPAGLVHFGDSERFVKLVAAELSANLIDDKNWALGPVLNYRFARDDVDDPVVDRFTDIEATVEAGLFGGYSWVGPKDPRQRLSTSVQILQDAAGEHEGFLITGALRYFHPVAKPLTLSVGFSATYGSSDYMQTYFGVDAVNAARSGLRRFDADAGFRDMRFPIMAIFSFSSNWHLAGGVIFSRLLEDASESPVTRDRGDEDQFYVGLGMAYAW